MTVVVPFEDYTPPARFDGIPWTDAQILEATSQDGPLTVIDTVSLGAPDEDPAHPQARDFSTTLGSAPDLWYAVTFLDAIGNSSQPTLLVKNGPPAALGRDLCTLADIADRVPGYNVGDDTVTDAVLADFISIESRDFMEETRREITPITPGSSTRVFDVDWIVIEERELLIGDAADVTGIALKGQDGTILQMLDSSAWVDLPRVREDWEPVTAIAFPALVTDPAFFAWPAAQWGHWVPAESPRLLCEVTGAWGFPKIPKTVARAVATLTIFRYLNDAAAAGTTFADAADRAELNLAGALKAAFDVRDRFRVPSVG